VGSERDAGEEHVHVSVVEAGHDEAVLEVVGDETVCFGFGLDFIVASYVAKDTGRGDYKGFGPWVLWVDGEDAAVDVGCAVVTWSLSGVRSHGFAQLCLDITVSPLNIIYRSLNST